MNDYDDLPPVGDGSREVALSPALVEALRQGPTDEELEALTAEIANLRTDADLLRLQDKTADLNARMAAQRLAAQAAVALWDASSEKSHDELAMEVAAEFERFVDMAGAQRQKMLDKGFDDSHAQYAGLQVHHALVQAAIHTATAA